MDIKEMEETLAPQKKKTHATWGTHNTLGTGSTMLNLACTGKPQCGFPTGKFIFLVGDSASGKTFLALTCLAEAALNQSFEDYRFIYDNVEDGALMDFARYFGKKVARKVEAPGQDDNGPVHSSTIEEFYFHVDDALKDTRPFIYILDSMDALTSKDEGEKFDETKEAMRKGKSVSGSYGDGKAKKNSANLRRLLTPLQESKSILIVISQTRDSLGFGFETKTRSGGHALRFYACLEIWSSIIGRIKRTVKGKPRTIGITCGLQVKKNRITGQERKVQVPIYYSHGFDDVGSCVNYLLEEKHWVQKGQRIKAQEWDFIGTKDALIEHIEENSLERELQGIVFEVWQEIEQGCSVSRKKKY